MEKDVEKEDNVPRKVVRKKRTTQNLFESNKRQSLGWDERLLISTSQEGIAAEYFRRLRTRIFHHVKGKRPRSILVTSTIPGEGKTFVCASLAFSFAQDIGQHCLTIDCDLRKPSLHKLFGLRNDKGVVDYLYGNEDISNLIAKTGVEKLSVIPAGPPPGNPAELIGSNSMVTLVEEIVGRYDDRIILLDSPPYQAAAETQILAKHVDSVVLVVKCGGSRREHVKEIVKLIGKDKIIGLVFNAHDVSSLDSMFFGYPSIGYNFYYTTYR